MQHHQDWPPGLARLVAAVRLPRRVPTPRRPASPDGAAFNLTAQTGIHHSAGRRRRSTPGATAVRAPPARLRAVDADHHRVLQQHAGSRADVDRHRRQPVTVTLTNNLPAAAGNTSILFPGFTVSAAPACRTAGLVDQRGGARVARVTYTFTAARRARAPTTAVRRATCRSRWVCTERSSSCPTRQRFPSVPAARYAGLPLADSGNNRAAKANWSESDFRLAAAAYDNAEDLLRPRISVPVLGNGPEHPHAGAGAGHRSATAAGATGCSLRYPPSLTTRLTS